ncbi:hypothetical protein GIW50_25190 [Pseudomonas syringae]|uniref:Lipoprotein n=1 Tax=Pseudomonas syringae TaxID=317 RepID=A0A9Q3X5M7_PSESX|nr:hypothetical protein [Pseudomonas syringae]MCF5064280.1 hypothetical protein [Pseudomonas syringae]MCF5075637.1 hypothetical protein [Pseudomonas syringae]MCF5121694.1 hypothetical protein [Pseudomonas syringae]MCF5380976.1 hypothetical protein [Pseudomonas syringae]
MKCSILTVIVLGALTLGAAQAQELQTVPVAPAPTPGAPGTPTPTLYPQVTPPAVPKTNGSPPLVPIVLPTPPKDQTVPGLLQNDSKPKTPGG